MRLQLLLFIAVVALLSCQPKTPAPAVQTPAPTTALSDHPTEPNWAASAVLYECNVRQFSPEGNLNGVRKQLSRLQALGINVLWLMPIHPIGLEKRKETPNDLGSPYSVADYYAVNPDFGTTDDLRALVQEAHALGIKVILDWVPNHSAWDAVWMKTHPEYYTKVNGQFTAPLNEHGGSTGWDDCADLDYNNPALRSAMITAMQYWVRTCDVDGFRCDMAGLVPPDFWQQTRHALDSIKPLFLLAEWQDEPLHFKAFNANYGWRWKDVTKDIWAGKQTARALDTLLQHLDHYYPQGYYQMYFTQNHDENTWAGTEADLYGASADAFNVLAFTWQGMPMIYSGQEDASTQRLAFFKKDPIRWKDYAKTGFFQKLCSLKHSNRALDAGPQGGPVVKIPTDADDSVYAFMREKNGDRVIVVLNLSKQTRTVTLHFDPATLGDYMSLFVATTVQVTKDMTLTLKPWEYLVLTNR